MMRAGMGKIGTRRRQWLACVAAGALGVAMVTAAAPAAAQEPGVTFQIKAQPLAEALLDLSRQSGVDIMAPEELTRGRTAPAVSGQMPVSDALAKLLKGSGLVAKPNGKSWVVSAEKNAFAGVIGAGTETSASNGEDTERELGIAENEKGFAEILVVGRRTRNVDIRRSENDPRPYVVFDHEDLEKSNAQDLESFLKTRLPQNSQANLASQNGAGTMSSPSSAEVASSNISAVNLRGLGVNQTLILVDGRRLPRVAALNGSDLSQGDINGIPLASIDRIEILPSSAGGIYGGDAVGGVVNIIRKRDYKGFDLRVGYAGTFRGGGESLRLDLSGGFALNHGTTQISFALSRQTASPLYMDDNRLWRRGREIAVANDPLLTIFNGATPNIRSSNGAPLIFDACGGSVPAPYCGTPLGSNHTFVPPGYAGTGSDGGSALVPNAGRYNIELSPDAHGARATLLNNPDILSGNLDLQQHVASNFDVYLDFTANRNTGRALFSGASIVQLPANAVNNPFQQAISIAFPAPELDRPTETESRTLMASGGFIWRLSPSWSLGADYSWSRARTKTTSTGSLLLTSAGRTALSNGTLDVTRDLSEFPVDYSPYIVSSPALVTGPYSTTLNDASVRVSGKLLKLPGGPLMMNGSLGYRNEQIGLGFQTNQITGNRTGTPPRSQEVKSIYLEMTAPLISSASAIPLIRRLELQASIRHDSYNTRDAIPANFTIGPAAPLPDIQSQSSTFKSTDVAAALVYAPVPDVTFRASYGTGFRPPSVTQIATLSRDGFIGLATDPRRGNELVGTSAPYTLLLGGSSSLKPEDSRSVSAGLIITPRWITGLRFSVDYTRIRKSNEITSPDVNYLILHEGDFPNRIVRGAKPVSDPASWAGPITFVDLGLINLNFSKTKAYDFKADYSFSTSRLGQFHLYGIATYQKLFERRLTATSIKYDSAGFSDGPLKWRGNVGFEWTYGRLSISWNTQYYDDYSIRLADPSATSITARRVMLQGSERIPSQSYSDIDIRYQFGDSKSQLLRGVELNAGIQNVFDKSPPPIAQLYNGYSSYGDPRLRRYSVNLRKHF